MTEIPLQQLTLEQLNQFNTLAIYDENSEETTIPIDFVNEIKYNTIPGSYYFLIVSVAINKSVLRRQLLINTTRKNITEKYLKEVFETDNYSVSILSPQLFIPVSCNMNNFLGKIKDTIERGTAYCFAEDDIAYLINEKLPKPQKILSKFDILEL